MSYKNPQSTDQMYKCLAWEVVGGTHLINGVIIWTIHLFFFRKKLCYFFLFFLFVCFLFFWYILIMLLQLSLFRPFTQLHPVQPLPPTFPPYSSCPWVILISSLASTFPTLFLPSPCLFSTYHLCYLFSVPLLLEYISFFRAFFFVGEVSALVTRLR